MTLPLFFSDMDQTLIYSLKQLKKYNDSSTGCVVAEEYINVPLSFFDKGVYDMLKEHSSRTFDFIPVTTRTVLQFQRIGLKNISYDTAVVLNGAKILVSGEEDKEWTESIETEIHENYQSPHEIWKRLRNDLIDCSIVSKINNADDFFVYLVLTEGNHDFVHDYTDKLVSDVGYIKSVQGHKIYLIPPAVDKGKAIHEIKKRKDSEYVISSGDSVLDVPMSVFSNIFIYPSHGHKISKTINNCIHTQSKGVRASQEIVKYVVQWAKNI